MFRRLLGAVVAAWGLLILVSRARSGEWIAGYGAFAAGQAVGLVVAVVLVIAGLYTMRGSRIAPAGDGETSPRGTRQD